MNVSEHGGHGRGGDARALLADLPKLHFWGGSEQVGGLNAVIGDRIIAEWPATTRRA